MKLTNQQQEKAKFEKELSQKQTDLYQAYLKQIESETEALEIKIATLTKDYNDSIEPFLIEYNESIKPEYDATAEIVNPYLSTASLPMRYSIMVS